MFDPYRKWLGISEANRPPTHYQLLAIEPTETDPDVIRAAVTQRSAYVRNFQAGKHADDATRLLNEIAAAEACLTNKEKRAAYDAELRAKAPNARVGAPPAPLAPPASSLFDPALEQLAAAPPLPSWLSPPRRRRSLAVWQWTTLGGCGMLALVVVAAAVAARWGVDGREIATIATNAEANEATRSEGTSVAAEQSTAATPAELTPTPSAANANGHAPPPAEVDPPSAEQPWRIPAVDTIVLSRSGRFLLAGINVWDLETGAIVGYAPATWVDASAVALSDDGRLFASVRSSRVIVWDTAANSPAQRLKRGGEASEPRYVDFLDLDRIVVTAKRGRIAARIVVHSASTGEALDEFTVQRCARELVSPDGVWLAGLFREGLHLVAVADGTVARTLELPEALLGSNQAASAAFSADSREVAIVLPERGRLLCWQCDASQPVCDVHLPVEAPAAEERSAIPAGSVGKGPAAAPIAWSPGGDGWLLFGRYFVARADGRVLWSNDEAVSGFSAAGFASDGRLLVRTIADDRFELRDVPWGGAGG